ncbi:hypothetical protein GCM10023196_069400 [Actinoallomurus vinaceus]|uniref:Uncharacterized protein n=1 Tax=Actinoallomurus vinaceus TaxID=1080074 RepID=A0ABP8UJ46_9ACTN
MGEEPDGGRIAGFVDEERRLTGLLDGLAPAARAALAAAVAARLLPHYWRFHEQTGLGEPLVLQGALGGVWDLLEQGSAIDIVTVGVACMDQAFVAAEFGFTLAGTRAWEAWRVVNGAATPLVENAVHAAWAVAGACHVAVHGGVTETLHCLRYGRGAALATAHSRRQGAEVQSVRAAESDLLVEQEERRQLLDIEMLGRSALTAQVLAELRRPT